MSKPRLFTGITPTGNLHLGHYCGFLQHILSVQEKYEVIIMIGDLHALSSIDPGSYHWEKGIKMAALLYACGLKPKHCKIFIQSQISEHTELTSLLSPYVTVDRLKHMIQYKQKAQKPGANLSLLSYPVLMAADLFMYDADLVVVGQDQTQHLELSTEIAKKINTATGKKILKLPEFFIPTVGSKIMGLKDPTKKMSKTDESYENVLNILDDGKIIDRKIRSAKTDSEGRIYYDVENKPGISNLLTVYSVFSNQQIAEVEKQLSNASYEQFKNLLICLLSRVLEPIKKKYQEYLKKIKYLLAKNNHRMKKMAVKKIARIKKAMNLS